MIFTHLNIYLLTGIFILPTIYLPFYNYHPNLKYALVATIFFYNLSFKSRSSRNPVLHTYHKSL